jgi:MFS family permease
MSSFIHLLRRNRNYRYIWVGQVVSEVGDHFNNIGVFSLALEKTASGPVAAGIMPSRALPVIATGPIAGVLLDRVDRRRVMIWSDLVRAMIALGFILTVGFPRPWLLYTLSTRSCKRTRALLKIKRGISIHQPLAMAIWALIR